MSLFKIFILGGHRFDAVYYYTANPWALRLSKLFFRRKTLAPVEIVEARVVLYDELKDMKAADEGKIPQKMFLEELFEELQEFLKFIGGEYNPEKMFLFFTQEMAVEFKTAIQLIYHIGFNAEHDPVLRQAHNTVVIRNSYWVDYLKKHYKDRFDVLTVYPNVRSGFGLVHYPFKIFLEWMVNSLLFLLQFKPKAIESTRPKVAVFYSHGVNPKQRCDYFWYPNSGLKADDMIVYFKHHGKSPTKDNVETLEALKIPWVNFLNWRFYLRPSNFTIFELTLFPTRDFLRKISSLCRIVFLRLPWMIFFKKRSDRWFMVRFLQLFDDVFAFEAFFDHYNIKIHYGSYEAGRHMMASNIAIDRLGGVDLCHHWSVLDMVDVHIGKPQDVYFTWGPYFIKHFFDKPYYHIKNYVYFGYPYDYSFSINKDNAKIYRSQLREHGVKFIVSFFDQAMFQASSMWNHELERIWKHLLELVVHNPDFGLIAKPKKANTVDDLAVMYPHLADLIKQAVATHRCLILGSKAYPNEAAQASDLAVGVGMSSTPCIEAALLGIPTITYNLERTSSHPFFVHGVNKTVFSDFEKLRSTIDDFIQGKQPMGMGDYSYVLHELDPFRDGGASNRVGFYIKHLLDCFKENRTKEQAIQFVNKIYQEKYGRDKVYIST